MSLELEEPTVYWPYGMNLYTPWQIRIAERLLVLRPGLLVILEEPGGPR